jgi:hypothetical protein
MAGMKRRSNRNQKVMHLKFWMLGAIPSKNKDDGKCSTAILPCGYVDGQVCYLLCDLGQSINPE